MLSECTNIEQEVVTSEFAQIPSKTKLIFLMSFDKCRGWQGQKWSLRALKQTQQLKSMTAKMVAVQLEWLKLFTYQSQKKGPFPIPHNKSSSLKPVSLPSWDRIAGSQDPIALLYTAEDPG